MLQVTLVDNDVELAIPAAHRARREIGVNCIHNFWAFAKESCRELNSVRFEISMLWFCSTGVFTSYLSHRVIGLVVQLPVVVGRDR